MYRQAPFNYWRGCAHMWQRVKNKHLLLILLPAGCETWLLHPHACLPFACRWCHVTKRKWKLFSVSLSWCNIARFTHTCESAIAWLHDLNGWRFRRVVCQCVSHWCCCCCCFNKVTSCTHVAQFHVRAQCLRTHTNVHMCVCVWRGVHVHISDIITLNLCLLLLD